MSRRSATAHRLTGPRRAIARQDWLARDVPVARAADDGAVIAQLKADLEQLRGRLPSQSHAMMDVDYHFTNLWFAGQGKNWPLAQFYLDETRRRSARGVR